MLAATYRRYGPPEVVTITEMPRPVPGPGQILVRVEAAAVTTADWRLRAAAFPGVMALIGRAMFGITGPRKPVLGHAFAGRIEAAGPGAEKFAIGAPVFGLAQGGAHAEYLVMPEAGAVAERPEALSAEEAASLPFGGLSALVFLRDIARVAPGARVLVLGGSGGVGSAAVQIARSMGARVTAAAGRDNQGLLTRLGADVALDYTATDPLDHGPFDLVLDPAGITTFARARRALAPGGIFLPLEFGFREMGQALLNPFRSRKIRIGISGDTGDDMERLGRLAENGALRPVIDSRHGLSEIAAAHARVESRHARGAVIVTMPGAQAVRPGVAAARVA